MFAQQSCPYQRSQNLHIEAVQIAAIVIFFWGAKEYLLKLAARNAILGLDIEHIEVNIPIAEERRLFAGEALVIKFKKIEGCDGAE